MEFGCLLHLYLRCDAAVPQAYVTSPAPCSVNLHVSIRCATIAQIHQVMTAAPYLPNPRPDCRTQTAGAPQPQTSMTHHPSPTPPSAAAAVRVARPRLGLLQNALEHVSQCVCKLEPQAPEPWKNKTKPLSPVPQAACTQTPGSWISTGLGLFQGQGPALSSPGGYSSDKQYPRLLVPQPVPEPGPESLLPRYICNA